MLVYLLLITIIKNYNNLLNRIKNYYYTKGKLPILISLRIITSNIIFYFFKGITIYRYKKV